MVGDARPLILLPLETRQVAPDNTVVLTLKLGNQTWSRFTQLIIVVRVLFKISDEHHCPFYMGVPPPPPGLSRLCVHI